MLLFLMFQIIFAIKATMLWSDFLIPKPPKRFRFSDNVPLRKMKLSSVLTVAPKEVHVERI